IKRAFEKIKRQYKTLLQQFQSGLLAGILSSVMNTLINIFFTTAKNVGKILRETWVSITEAVNTLSFNPDHLPCGELLSAVVKVLGTGVAVSAGVLIQEAVGKLPALQLPVINEVLPLFVGSMASGLLSITLVYFLDHSPLINKLVAFANHLKSQANYTLEY